MSSLRRHPWRVLSVGLLVVVGAGAFVNRDLIGLVVSSDDPIDLTLPIAAPLEAQGDEVVYRIDAGRSELVVGVDEILAGVDRRVELTTQGLAGDVAIATAGSPSVRVGEVVVDVHDLRSDNALRDKALRHEFLESHTHPKVRLLDATVTLPDDVSPGRVEDAVVEGTLEIKGEDHPSRWEIDARIVGDTLTATATTTVKMSDLGVGPISKVGLVRTSDDVDLTLKLVAVDGSDFEPPTGLSVDKVESRAEGAGPSFASDVLPILEQNCASCHGSGSVGNSMWSLETAGDAAEVADGLAVVTGAGYMPPWPASDLGIEMKHSRGLSEEQIRTISDWAAAGGQLDVEPESAVSPPTEPEVRQPRPDRVVTLAEPYKGTPEQKDDYRCFILDPEVTEPSFLTGYTFDPDRLEVVHHAIVYRVLAGEGRAGAEAKDAAAPGSGWPCLAGMGADEGQRIAGWVPGQRPVALEEGEGFALNPGDVLVAQIHYHYNADSPADRSGMTLELADSVEGMTALQSRTLIGPVELPCPPGTASPLCDREAAVADVGVRFGPGGSAIANVLHRLCGTTIEEVASVSDGTTGSTTCDFPVRQGGEIIGLLAHMHEIGSNYRMTLNPGAPDEKILLDIPVWNFSWQLNYRPVEDVAIKAGDTLRVTCSWDRRHRFDAVPRYIVFAEGTEDEMCFTSFTVRPVPDPDAPA